MLRLWTKPTVDPPESQICTALLLDTHSSTSVCQPLPCAFARPRAGLGPLQDRCAGRRPACAPASPREGAVVAHGGSQEDNTAFHPLLLSRLPSRHTYPVSRISSEISHLHPKLSLARRLEEPHRRRKRAQVPCLLRFVQCKSRKAFGETVRSGGSVASSGLGR